MKSELLIGFYLGISDPGSAYGTAGSLAIILLLGAEFTQVWDRHHGSGIRPETGAMRVVEKEKRVPADDAKEQLTLKL